jgi:hypothetical protein
MSVLNRANIALMLCILSYGTMLGGIVYSHMVYFPAYLSALPDSAVIVNGPYALHEEVFWMMIHPLNIIFLTVALVANWRIKPRRTMIAATFAIYVVVLIVSSLYFIPQLAQFKRSPWAGLPPAEWAARSKMWMRLSITRGTICYLSFFPLLVALSTPPTWKRSSSS